MNDHRFGVIRGGAGEDGTPTRAEPAAEAVRRIKEQVEARRLEEEKKHGAGGGGSGEEVDSKFVRDCLWANELGDGMLFARLHRGKLVHNNSMDSWMRWAGHHWEVDSRDRALASAENVVGAYKREAAVVAKELGDVMGDEDRKKEAGKLMDLKNKLNARVKRLRERRGRANALHWAYTSTEDPLNIKGDEVDQKPWLLPLPNGVLNLKTGELEDGRPEDYLLSAGRVEWQGIDAPAPIYEKTLLEIYSGNERLVEFVQRVVGMGLIGKVTQSVIIVFVGGGRNGKSMEVKLWSDILGTLAGPIRSEMLLDQTRNISSTGPTPDVMALRGRRLAFASETDEGCKISPSRVKWFTGDDRLTGRNPHDKYPVEWDPTHTLFLLTNHKPHAPADDFAFWERMVLIPHQVSFVDREPKTSNEVRADLLLPAKLRAELPGILAWMVKGCLQYQKIGLDPPPIVKKEIEEYRRDEDIIADFLDECCEVFAGAETGSTQLYNVFEAWWKINVSHRVPKQKKFGTLMKKRYERVKDGTYKYRGIIIKGELPFDWPPPE